MSMLKDYILKESCMKSFLRTCFALLALLAFSCKQGTNMQEQKPSESEEQLRYTLPKFVDSF